MTYSTFTRLFAKYLNHPKYWNRQARANGVDLNQAPKNMASAQGLHCLPFIQQLLKHQAASKYTC